jgi:hypothetical protein
MEIAQRLINAYPELEGRAIKGVVLVAQDAVEATEHSNLFNVRLADLLLERHDSTYPKGKRRSSVSEVLPERLAVDTHDRFVTIPNHLWIRLIHAGHFEEAGYSNTRPPRVPRSDSR